MGECEVPSTSSEPLTSRKSVKREARAADGVVESKKARRISDDARCAPSGVPDFPSLTRLSRQFLLDIDSMDDDDFDLFVAKDVDTKERNWKIRLCGFWQSTEIAIGNRVRLIDPVVSDGVLEVNDFRGILIIEPNALISATNLVQGLFCQRKAVLSEKYRVNQANIQMTLGNVCHELFQRALEQRPTPITESWMMGEYRQHLLPRLILDFIIIGIKSDDFESQLQPYIANITAWMKKHMPAKLGENRPLSDGNVIADIEDIEMDCQSTVIGMKGKIDVAIRTHRNRVIPLELKTGQSKVSTDHQAQVLMYLLLLSERMDGGIDSGLLMYLKDGTERAVAPRGIEMKHLLQVRNALAAKSTVLLTEALPAPRSDSRFCSKCQYATHCTVVQRLANSANSVSSEWRQFMTDRTAHLTEAELAFTKKWLRWLFMEWEASRKRTEETTAVDEDSANQTSRCYTANSMLLNAVITVLADSEEAKRVRELVVDLKAPCKRKMAKSDYVVVAPLVKNLSRIQQRAIVTATMSRDYLLVQGFPGSGKTTTIVALVRCLVALGRSVLLTAYTNSAVDNMLEKLRQHMGPDRLVRITSAKTTTGRQTALQGVYLDDKIARWHAEQKSVADVQRLLMEVPVVATTCLMAGSSPFFQWRRRFDYCIVDEAALAMQAAVLQPLLLGVTNVLVGDTRQLEPLVLNNACRAEGMAVSLMERWEPVAEEHGAVTRLHQQFRMNSTICELSSRMFYDGLMQCANEEVANRTLHWNGHLDAENLPPDFLPSDLIEALLSGKKSDSVIFIDTASRSAKGDLFKTTASLGSKHNAGEVQLVAKLCRLYDAAHIEPTCIGVMSTYRSQVEHLRKVLPAHIETNTVDQFQGRDKDVMLLSLVHTSAVGEEVFGNALLSDRRLNVALTRAKRKLVVVGCRESLETFPAMKQLFSLIQNHHKL